MNVLIVEDDGEKLRHIVQVLLDCGVDSSLISEARSSIQAKQMMHHRQFDLLLIDMQIPRRVEEEPSPGEGVNLLREISERDRYYKPTHVLGVTAYSSEFNNAEPVFNAALVPIFRYEREGTDWAEPLRQRLRYLVESNQSQRAGVPSGYDYDVAILTALAKPELAAVLDLDWEWEERQSPNDDTTYHSGRTKTGRRVIAAHAPFMGMAASSILATKTIEQFRPKHLIHVGIAAGIRGEAEIGDVLVADPSWDWGSGKFKIEEDQLVFFASPYQILLREEIRSSIRRLISDENSLATIRGAWRGAKPSSILSARLGPVASGASVLADGEIKERIRDQHRKLIGIEMETYGVMSAAEFSTKPRPTAVSLKSVCDYADGEKNDIYQPYAAYTSAQVMSLLVERFLFDD